MTNARQKDAAVTRRRYDPSANFTADEKLANEIESVVKNLAGQISIHAMSSQTQQPSLTIT